MFQQLRLYGPAFALPIYFPFDIGYGIISSSGIAEPVLAYKTGDRRLHP
jgi:hypothetical protein